MNDCGGCIYDNRKTPAPHFKGGLWLCDFCLRDTADPEDDPVGACCCGKAQLCDCTVPPGRRFLYRVRDLYRRSINGNKRS